MKYNFGIDLGTTNSSIIGFDGTSYRVFKNKEQAEVTPSAVYIDKKNRSFIGRQAYESAILHPEDVALEFKRLMGTKEVFRFLAAGRQLAPEELSAEILKALIADAQKFSDGEIDFAVITIPAAFRALQCEATNKAAHLAGLNDIALLMEPVAASISFGADRLDISEKWIVYDLGGGTFDVAIVAHQDNLLSVLEHSGNNMLGGKNIDDKILDGVILKRLQQNFNLPSKENYPDDYINLRRRLKSLAEGLKIELSSSNKATVFVDDVGADMDGRDYSCRFDVLREEIDQLVSPLVFDTVFHCREVLKAAALEPGEISRILLVGGPTQMPILREILGEELGIPLDYSIDPMTVVAKGAATYASRADRLDTKARKAQSPPPVDQISIDLSYQSVSASMDPLVVGKLLKGSAVGTGLQVCFEANTGHWSSPWIPIINDEFETRLFLQPHSTSSFDISIRDSKGHRVPCNPKNITIRHGVEFDDFKLPHTISILVENPDGTTYLEPIFRRNIPLPAESKIRRLAARSLLPNSVDSLDIHVFEGEVLDSPQANEYLFTVRIRGEEISRPIPAGAPIDILMKMSNSRILKACAYVELLDLTLDKRFVPEDSEIDAKTLHQKTRAQLDLLIEDLNHIEDNVRIHSDDTTRIELEHIKDRAYGVDIEASQVGEADVRVNPDHVKRIHEDVQRLNRELYRLKHESGLRSKVDIEAVSTQFEEVAAEVRSLFEQSKGRELIPQFNRIYQDGSKCYETQSLYGLGKCLEKMKGLRWQIWSADPEFWQGSYNYFLSIRATLKNQKEADRLFALGKVHVDKGDSDELQKVVWELWDLLPNREAQEKALTSGIRRS